mmetsp:Transcript_12464/g.41039  ORF Transcript_12464/g.41039 Transcript_12464/m.41039 type:complete len:423 (+) Transcript_12464:7-1275(+)
MGRGGNAEFVNRTTGGAKTIRVNEQPFSEGTFRRALKGVFVDGERKGQPCVNKEYKPEVVPAWAVDDQIKADLKCVEFATEMAIAFNELGLVEHPVRVNQPKVLKQDKSMTEPWVEGFKKWNSNSGWCEAPGSSDPWNDVMQALSHFSFHRTRGRRVLVDLQGGGYANCVVISDPAVLSTDSSYGSTDLGPSGIENFMARHKCGRFCQASWRRSSAAAGGRSVRETTRIPFKTGRPGGVAMSPRTPERSPAINASSSMKVAIKCPNCSLERTPEFDDADGTFTCKACWGKYHLMGCLPCARVTAKAGPHNKRREWECGGCGEDLEYDFNVDAMKRRQQEKQSRLRRVSAKLVHCPTCNETRNPRNAGGTPGTYKCGDCGSDYYLVACPPCDRVAAKAGRHDCASSWECGRCGSDMVQEFVCT